MPRMKAPLISVALTTYNGEKYLEEQLESIYAQSYPNIEVIASDDGSKDGTLAILKKYQKKRSLNLAVNVKNLGFIKNFEKAVSLCRGDFIALADQDDVWKPEKLEMLLSGIGNHSLVCSDAEVVDENGSPLYPSLSRLSGHFAETDDQFAFFVFRNYVTGHTTMLRRDLVRKALPIPDGVMYHDWWFALVASGCLNGVKYVDCPLTKYRQHAANDTGASRSLGVMEKFAEFRSKKEGGFNREIRHLQALLDSRLFSQSQKQIIKDRFDFYQDLLRGAWHPGAFRIALRYRQYILAGKSPLFRAAFLLGTLVQ